MIGEVSEDLVCQITKFSKKYTKCHQLISSKNIQVIIPSSLVKLIQFHQSGEIQWSKMHWQQHQTTGICETADNYYQPLSS
jgi:hypothetical protein